MSGHLSPIQLDSYRPLECNINERTFEPYSA